MATVAQEVSEAERAELITRWHEQMRRRIQSGEILFDAGRWEFYEERSGNSLLDEDQRLLKLWQSEGIIEITQVYSHRKCKVTSCA